MLYYYEIDTAKERVSAANPVVELVEKSRAISNGEVSDGSSYDNCTINFDEHSVVIQVSTGNVGSTISLSGCDNVTMAIAGC